MISLFYKIANGIRRFLQRILNMSTVGVKALIINSEMEILLVKHTYMPGWHFPGGGVNPGETPKRAVLREVQEEAGIVALGEPELFGIYAHQIMGADDYPILYVIRNFEVLSQQGDPREILEVKWFHYQNLPQDVSESTKIRVNEVFQKLPPIELW